MKLNGVLVHDLYHYLHQADSTDVQGKAFIKINRRRLESAFGDIQEWIKSSTEAAPETPKAEMWEAFNVWLREQMFDVDAYTVTKDIFDVIGGVSIKEEGTLYALTTEFAAEEEARLKAKEPDQEETIEVEETE